MKVSMTFLTGIFRRRMKVREERAISQEETRDEDLHLGSRMIVVGGKVVGTCEDMHLTIGAATDQDIEKLRNARKIELIKIEVG